MLRCAATCRPGPPRVRPCAAKARRDPPCAQVGKAPCAIAPARVVGAIRARRVARPWAPRARMATASWAPMAMAPRSDPRVPQGRCAARPGPKAARGLGPTLAAKKADAGVRKNVPRDADNAKVVDMVRLEARPAPGATKGPQGAGALSRQRAPRAMAVVGATRRLPKEAPAMRVGRPAARRAAPRAPRPSAKAGPAPAALVVPYVRP